MHILSVILLLSNISSKLLSVYIVQRHGDRTPLVQLPNAPSFGTLGVLTAQGMNRCIQTGKFFARRYLGQNDFPTTYDTSNFFFYTTDVNRVKDSQMSVAHGLFGNSSGPVYPEGYDAAGEPVFDSGLTPIPVMAMLDHNDYILLGATTCMTSIRKMASNQESETLQQYHRDMETVYEKLFEQTGMSAKGYDISDICDAVMYMHDQGMDLPGNMTEDDYEKYVELYDYLYLTYFPVYDKDFCAAANGLFMQKLLRNVVSDTQKYDNGENYTHFYHFGCHDWSLLSMFGCLNLTTSFNPRYASFIAVEVYVDEDDSNATVSSNANVAQTGPHHLRSPSTYHIGTASSSVNTTRITFKFYSSLNPGILGDEEDANMTQFYPDACGNGTTCYFDDLQEQWADWWPEDNRIDWMGEVCGLERTGSTTTLLVVWIILMVLFIVLFILFIVLCHIYIKVPTTNATAMGSF